MQIGHSFLTSSDIEILDGDYPTSVLEAHKYHDDGPTWKIGKDGLVIIEEGSWGKPERTVGEPQTVRRIMKEYGDHIGWWAAFYWIPIDVIIACIATETGGVPDARREEPGFKSDKETPHRVSTGLMQTLFSTAQRMVPDAKVTNEWLSNPNNSIRAGVAYIHHQSQKTKTDPPLVAAAYNSGGLYRQNGKENRWKLRNYPIGTGHHIDRFVKFYNDSFSQKWWGV